MKKPDEPVADGAEAPKPRVKMKSLLEAAEKSYAVPQSQRKKRPLIPIRAIIELCIGWKIRFLAGSVFIACWLLWMYQTGLFVPFKNPDQELMENLKLVWEGKTDPGEKLILLGAKDKSLLFPLVPDSVLRFLTGFGVGLAGFLLILSAGWRSLAVNIFFFPAIGILLFGPMLGMPESPDLPFVGVLEPRTVSLAIGGMIALIGLVYFVVFRDEGRGKIAAE